MLLTFKAKVIAVLIFLTICGIAFAGIKYTIDSKNREIKDLQEEVSSLKIQKDNLEKNARIDKMITGLNLRLGQSWKEKALKNTETFNEIEKRLETDYVKASGDETKQSQVLIDSIWNGFEATQ